MSGQICQMQASLPFGKFIAAPALAAGVTACNPSPTFMTGKERDPETGLDDFGGRYLSSKWGHWMSPDWSATPVAVPYAHLESPQSFNLYAYVGNDPINGEDPDGHARHPYPDNPNDGSWDPSDNPGALLTNNVGAHNPVRDHQYNPTLIAEDTSMGDYDSSWFGQQGSSPASSSTSSNGTQNSTVDYATAQANGTTASGTSSAAPAHVIQVGNPTTITQDGKFVGNLYTYAVTDKDGRVIPDVYLKETVTTIVKTGIFWNSSTTQNSGFNKGTRFSDEVSYRGSIPKGAQGIKIASAICRGL